MHNPPHPGLVLREYLGSIRVSEAANHLRVTRVTLSRVLNGKAGISASMALRLAAALGTSPEFWMNMQAQYDLWQASRRKQPTVQRLSRQTLSTAWIAVTFPYADFPLLLTATLFHFPCLAARAASRTLNAVPKSSFISIASLKNSSVRIFMRGY
jgi:antitoxin HigA-1